MSAASSPRRRAGRGWAWTAKENAIVRRDYADTPTAVLATRLRRTPRAVYFHAKRLGLTKSDAYLASPAAGRLQPGTTRGRRTQFPKGHVPHNKGLRRPGWSAGRMADTQFKKGAREGQAARNWMPIGATRLIDGYLYRKVADERNVPYTVNWKPEHVLRWTAAHGPIPAGHALAFKDGNRHHVRLDNLELITRVELMRRNSIYRLPPAIVSTLKLIGTVRRQIRRREHAPA